MKIRVFGKDTDDKGAQLEIMTKRLLESRGYRQVGLNSIGSGGTEIDIVAEQSLPGLNRTDSIEVIGECKAYEGPIAQPELTKFLGKLFLLKVKRKSQVKGIFVALSGVNGAFDGAYRDFSEHDNSVELVTGDALAEQVIREFKLPELREVLVKVGQLTSDPVASSSLGYYDAQAYWIIEFANSTFAVLGGARLDVTPSADMIQVMSSQLQAAKYRDLSQEQQAIDRRILSRKFALGQCLCKRSIELPDKLDPWFAQFSLGQADLDSASAELLQEGTLVQVGTSFGLSEVRSNLERRCSIIREMLNGIILFDFLDSGQWESMIDGDLLNESLRIQGNLAVNQSEREDLIKLMKWSPTALYWALTPDPLLTRPPENEQVAAVLAPEHPRWYRSQMIKHAILDFNGPVAAILFKRYGIVELQSSRMVAFKTLERTALDMTVMERIGLAKYVSTPSADAGPDAPIVQIWLTENQPEPWERQTCLMSPDAPSSN
jgi:Restriction endonuclease